MIRVLILDDERELREEMAIYTRGLGYSVTEVETIRQFHHFFVADKYEILILDRLLPDGDGLDLVAELRAANVRCGIIVCTGRDATKDRIEGFKTGADHYVAKPVRLEELGAMIKTLVWRLRPPDEWSLDSSQWVLHEPNGGQIKLTSQEFEFLKILSQHACKPVSRSFILDQMQKNPEHYDPRNLDALVLRLRKKIEEATPHPLPLKTVHGIGYVIAKIKQGD